MGKGRLYHLSVAMIAALLCGSGVAMAQSKGEITGRVLDAQGQPLPGIEVKLHDTGGEDRNQTSGADGVFRFEKLGFGTYSVTAAPEGYAATACPGFRLIPGTTKEFEIRLVPAGGEE
ncbi:MAG TPA: carboxypeptidase-like regulatory domain-containing protein, partial [Thermoanaerobaculia bacterium]|nr:carboxypeptidase-like regulatory domain-containing protein [Thermoanaerobaculia bacterium]